MVLLLLFYVPPIVCGVCLGMHYFVSFLVLQIVLTGKRELVTGCFSDVLLLLVFCGSSSRCRGLVYKVWL